jgi:hypothetical protein
MPRLVVLIVCLPLLAARAQPEPAETHAHAGHDPAATPAPAETDAHVGHHPGAPTEPQSTDPVPAPLGIPMSRVGSGTAWQPDSSPMPGVLFLPGAGWELMLHWNLAVGFDAQTTPRGGHQWTSMNWVMGMARHSVGTGLFTARVMLSAEPFTTGGAAGYPLLLQVGEEVNGQPLHDRQHPHDLFMELAVDDVPALGPVAFPHRISALPNPFATLGHHWQDSTHISFGVLTAGLLTRQWKLEGSWFNGREPDQNRYDLDFGSLDSWSVRLSFNPTDDWSLQVSYGHLASPEEHAPGVSVDRLTASALHNLRLGPEANWASALVFGNDWTAGHPATWSALAETSVEVGADTAFGRLELAQRTGEDLVLEASGGAPDLDGRVFTSAVLELGYLRRVARLGPLNIGLGAVGSLYLLDAGLSPFYGNTRWPVAGMLFLRLWPTDMHAGGAGHAEHAGHAH